MGTWSEASSRIALFALLGAASACTGTDDPCEDTDCETDTDDTDTGAVDTDTGEPPLPRTSQVTLEWTIEAVPNDNRVELRCGGRELFSLDNFTYRNTFSETIVVPAGDDCTVTWFDRRAGRLPGGRAVVCSSEVATWDSTRGATAEVATFTAETCTPGCADPVADNYDATANLDDGSCQYQLGCTDERAVNYDATATKDDGTCDFGGFGPVELSLFMDGEVSIGAGLELVCEGATALEWTYTNATWTTRTRGTVLDAGLTCEVILQDPRGAPGPSGIVEVCDEVVLKWGTIERQNDPWEVKVGTFFTSACSGCTDDLALNHDADALLDDGSCEYGLPQ